MKKSKNEAGSQMTGKSSKHRVLNIQLNDLQLEITSQNEQYSLVELEALLNIIAGNRNQLLAVSSSESPLSVQNLNEKSKDQLRYYIPSGASSRFSPIRENRDSENNGFRIEY